MEAGYNLITELFAKDYSGTYGAGVSAEIFEGAACKLQFVILKQVPCRSVHLYISETSNIDFCHMNATQAQGIIVFHVMSA